MLMTDIGDEMWKRQILDVCYGIGRFRHQHPLFSHECREPTFKRCQEYRNSVQRNLEPFVEVYFYQIENDQ